MPKYSLRSRLQQNLPQEDLALWFDPLRLSFDKERQVVSVAFPHRFFGDWFLQEKKELFENAVTGLWEDSAVEYSTTVGPSSSALLRPGRLEEAELPTGFEDFRFSFEGFITGRKNDFPFEAVKKAAEQPFSAQYVPVVLYGSSGSGKSHLLHAAARKIRELSTAAKVIVSSPEQLTSTGAAKLFSSDRAVFCLDDAQRLRENKALQSECIRLLDRCAAEKRLVIFSFDAHPASLSGLSAKLRARLSAGLVLELKKPDIEIRRRYIRQKAENMGLPLSKDQILTLAQHHEDLRAADGLLARMKAYKDLSQGTPSFAAFLGEAGGEKTLAPARIISGTAEFFSVAPESLSGRQRDKNIAEARRCALFLCRELLGISFAELGRLFGGRDHSSIVSAVKKVKQLQQSDKDMNKTIAHLKQMFLKDEP